MTTVSWMGQESMDLASWIECGRRLGTIARGVGWWLGDWLNFGNGRYGEKYTRAARITGYDVQSLRNMAYVASRFEASRRRANLSWSHHAEVAALAPEQQDVWLERAEQHCLSVQCMRGELRAYRRPRALRDGAVDGIVLAEARAVEPTCPHCGAALEQATGATAGSVLPTSG